MKHWEHLIIPLNLLTQIDTISYKCYLINHYIKLLFIHIFNQIDLNTVKSINPSHSLVVLILFTWCATYNSELFLQAGQSQTVLVFLIWVLGSRLLYGLDLQDLLGCTGQGTKRWVGPKSAGALGAREISAGDICMKRRKNTIENMYE